jgi:hypothetical protein
VAETEVASVISTKKPSISTSLGGAIEAMVATSISVRDIDHD